MRRFHPHRTSQYPRENLTVSDAPQPRSGQNKKPTGLGLWRWVREIPWKILLVHDLIFASRPQPATTAGALATDQATEHHDAFVYSPFFLPQSTAIPHNSIARLSTAFPAPSGRAASSNQVQSFTNLAGRARVSFISSNRILYRSRKELAAATPLQSQG
jgi:hypothetical protein